MNYIFNFSRSYPRVVPVNFGFLDSLKKFGADMGQMAAMDSLNRISGNDPKRYFTDIAVDGVNRLTGNDPKKYVADIAGQIIDNKLHDYFGGVGSSAASGLKWGAGIGAGIGAGLSALRGVNGTRGRRAAWGALAGAGAGAGLGALIGGFRKMSGNWDKIHNGGSYVV